MLRHFDAGGRPMDNAEFYNMHARVGIERDRAAGLRVYDDREEPPPKIGLPSRGTSGRYLSLYRYLPQAGPAEQPRFLSVLHHQTADHNLVHLFAAMADEHTAIGMSGIS
jgi:hypothetical protein